VISPLITTSPPLTSTLTWSWLTPGRSASIR
jgi:hypothetical protein